MYLTEGLIPVYNTEQRGLNGFRFHTDDAVMCMAVNHLFATQAERFGSDRTRDLIEDQIASYLQSPMTLNNDRYGKVSILPFLANLFEQHQIQPFKNVYAAFIGGNEYYDDSIFGRRADKFRSGFKKLRDFSERESLLTLEKSHQVVDGFDFVLSGNVLNAPGWPNMSAVFAACANILKPGGLAIHGLNYSADNYEVTLCDEFHAACSQTRIDDMEYKNIHDGRGDLIDAIVLRQGKKVRLQICDLEEQAAMGVIPPLSPAPSSFRHRPEGENIRAEIFRLLGRDLPGPELS